MRYPSACSGHALATGRWVVVFALLALAASAPVASQENTAMLTAVKDPGTQEVTLGNELVRLRFPMGQPRFGVFPKGYVGYTLEVRKDGEWMSVARAAYFTAFSFRSVWGRDFLHYIVPPNAEVSQDAASARAVFSDARADLDRGAWVFTFTFEAKPNDPFIHVTYTVAPEFQREVLLFQGPRLYVGDGSFGERKDEALFPGLEYLGPNDRSSHISALAPDARFNFAPDPAKITIPLMAVVCDGVTAGIAWDPRQNWYASHTGASVVFASPNWLEDAPNHLLGVFLPAGRDFVPENGLRADRPVTVEARGTLKLEADLFAGPATHVTDALEMWINHVGGLPKPNPPTEPPRELVNKLVGYLVDDIWSDEAKGWPWDFGGKAGPHVSVATALSMAIPFVDDPTLLERLRAQVDESAKGSAYFPLAIRWGGLDRALEVKRAETRAILDAQHEDGSWGYKGNDLAEGGLFGLMGPPEPGYIAAEDERSQGITADYAAKVMDYALISGDDEALAKGLRAIEDMMRYSIPFVCDSHECPQSPSLHGSFLGMRACLDAYRITGDRVYLDEAVYWAKTGLPFVYLWTLGKRDVERGQVHAEQRFFVEARDLYENISRDPMLYGALYGFGSSQYMHHWYGILVHWIGMEYALDLADLAALDDALPWKTLADGLISSGSWQTFDKAPYAGFFPDAFSVLRWVPSGPAFSPAALLSKTLGVELGAKLYDTVVVHDGEKRYHMTASRAVADAAVADGVLRFTIDDAGLPHCRVVVSGLNESAAVSVDGESLAATPALEEAEEGCMRTSQGLTVIKVRRLETPRRIEVTLAP